MGAGLNGIISMTLSDH